jgi:hypothetical protein
MDGDIYELMEAIISMKKIKIIIERGKDQYAAYAENVEGI